MATLEEINASIERYKREQEKGQQTSILQGERKKILDNVGKITNIKIREIERLLKYKEKKFDDGLLKEKTDV